MFDLSLLYSNETYKPFLLAVLEEIATYPREHEDKIYIGGSNNTHYCFSEREYNSGMLGVIASSKKMGNVLVMIVGMIIDENYEYVLNMLHDDQDYEEGHIFTMEEVIKFMSCDPEGCNACYSLTEESVMGLRDETFSVLKPKKMNKWNIQRVTDYITREHDFSIPV